ncbi:[Pyruvate dehydrogenase (acetyl-transferring)] kinase 1, mitochondrial [Cyberlindnera fabianii]|uniref:[Pyruvate dehydrogenase (Acetyl-transferring)] kinase 1, mitochondrial n=1 Tax=Cyberlindnera fabianii TaxID=36022 RepID=A0A1V2L3S2_CYBFA|nr:[Pyruvate dehydrogenase (acetyl-transferring)] kinase 1, mitochondrial [Cyberlindnera fabianii]
MTNNFIQSINAPENHMGIVNTKLKISDLVHIFAGFVNDMNKYYKQKKVVVYPPRLENNIYLIILSPRLKTRKQSGMGDNVMPGEDVDNVAGMGYGLPLTKAYVEQFGGRLEFTITKVKVLTLWNSWS